MSTSCYYFVATRGWWNVQNVALVQNEGFEMGLGSGFGECTACLAEDAAEDETRSSLPPAAPREDSAAGRVAHRLPQQPPPVAEQQPSKNPPASQPRHMRARLAPPPAAASRPTPGFASPVRLTPRGKHRRSRRRNKRAVASNLAEIPWLAVRLVKTKRPFACTAVSCQGSLVSPSKE